jgi:hypothetical protein
VTPLLQDDEEMVASANSIPSDKLEIVLGSPRKELTAALKRLPRIAVIFEFYDRQPPSLLPGVFSCLAAAVSIVSNPRAGRLAGGNDLRWRRIGGLW